MLNLFSIWIPETGSKLLTTEYTSAHLQQCPILFERDLFFDGVVVLSETDDSYLLEAMMASDVLDGLLERLGTGDWVCGPIPVTFMEAVRARQQQDQQFAQSAANAKAGNTTHLIKRNAPRFHHNLQLILV